MASRHRVRGWETGRAHANRSQDPSTTTMMINGLCRSQDVSTWSDNPAAGGRSCTASEIRARCFIFVSEEGGSIHADPSTASRAASAGFFYTYRSTQIRNPSRDKTMSVHYTYTSHETADDILSTIIHTVYLSRRRNITLCLFMFIGGPQRYVIIRFPRYCVRDWLIFFTHAIASSRVRFSEHTHALPPNSSRKTTHAVFFNITCSRWILIVRIASRIDEKWKNAVYIKKIRSPKTSLLSDMSVKYYCYIIRLYGLVRV